MNQQQIANVITFHALTSKLKTVIRTGWKRWNVQRDRLESVAEHIFSAQMLVVVMRCSFRRRISLNHAKAAREGGTAFRLDMSSILL